jgi:ribosomal protein S18 acetylase RimI-like enzyme
MTVPLKKIRPKGVLLQAAENEAPTNLLYRRAGKSDIPAMAEIRAGDWGTEEDWRERIRQYLAHEQNPREALRPRVAFVCVKDERIAGLIAGHLTRRFGCDGELEWISVRPEFRNLGAGFGLLCQLAEWFTAHHAKRVCVDVEPSNQIARRFYARHGAEDLKPHWMVWKDIRSLLRRSVADSK